MNQILEFHKAPFKTTWGSDMVVATIAIDKDHCADIYIEKEMIPYIDKIITVKEMLPCLT